MRFKLSKLLPALLAVIALTAVTASAAQAAAEGPFYKLTGARLAEGKTAEVKVKSSGEFLIGAAGGGGPEMSCEKVAFASGAKLLGSTGANFGSGEVTLEMSGCSIPAYNGCVVGEKGSFKTSPMKLELAYPEDARKGQIEVVLAEIKKAFINVKLTNRQGETGSESCDFRTQLTLDGSVVARIEAGKLGEVDEVGKEPVAAKTLKLTFAARGESKYVWLEKAGALARSEAVLAWEGKGAYFDGHIELELSTGAEWGVFT